MNAILFLVGLALVMLDHHKLGVVCLIAAILTLSGDQAPMPPPAPQVSQQQPAPPAPPQSGLVPERPKRWVI